MKKVPAQHGASKIAVANLSVGRQPFKQITKKKLGIKAFSEKGAKRQDLDLTENVLAEMKRDVRGLPEHPRMRYL